MLDPKHAYVLAGDRNLNGPEIDDGKAESVLHLRLSSETLSQLLQKDLRLLISDLDKKEPILTINDAQHVLQKTQEVSPHHIYRLDASGSSSKQSRISHLSHLGLVRTKYAIRPNSVPSSSATSRLKERREMEEARKSEHRAVLLESAPLTTKSKTSSTGLKLRPKGLAPSNKGSPIMHSRSGTPIDSTASSLPGSPAVNYSSPQGTQNTSGLKSSPLKRENSPTGLRRQLIQLLAKGPRSRRDIIQQIQFAESQILGILARIASTPDELQVKSSQTTTARKYTGPINRRGQTGGTATISTSPKSLESTQSTVYVLKDESYREVLIKDWEGYSLEDKIHVSALMEVALDRLGVAQDALPREQLLRDDKHRQRMIEKLDDGDELSEEDGAAHDTQNSQNKVEQMKITGVSKKPTTKERLARAAKGKLSSPRTSAVNAKGTAKTTPSDKSMKSSPSVTKLTETMSSTAPQSTAISSSKRKNVPLSRNPSNGAGVGIAVARSNNLKDINYTDSSDEEEQEFEEKSAKSHATGGQGKSDSLQNRPKSLANRGPHFAKEPWLQVRSTSEWHELANRFRRLYDDYRKGLSRVREEEDMLKSELQLARKDIRESEGQANGKRRNSVSSRMTRSTKGRRASNDGDTAMLGPGDEREEGEASPIIEQDSKDFAGPLAWRHGGDGDASMNNGKSPMPLEQMDDLVTAVLEMEGQLRRMKDALRSSKEQLES